MIVSSYHGVLDRGRQPWFSGNRQWSGAIKHVICVLQFDPVALGQKVSYTNSWAFGSLQDVNVREFLKGDAGHNAS